MADLPPGATEGYADVGGGIRLHYVERGEGPLMLFLHGFPQFWWLWYAQLGEFGGDHHAVAPDMRGFNLSSKPSDAEAYRMRHLIGDVRGLVTELGAQRCTLVGHDWGGIVAWALAIKHPELLERLVILDAPPPFTWGRELERSRRQREAVRYMVDLSKPAPLAEEFIAANEFAVLDALVIEPGLESGYLSEGDRARYHAAWTQPGAVTGGLNYYRAAQLGGQVERGQPPEVRAHMESLRVVVPTLVIWGEQDQMLLPGLTEGLGRWVPDVRVAILPGASHWTPQERPVEVNRLIRRFIAE